MQPQHWVSISMLVVAAIAALRKEAEGAVLITGMAALYATFA